MAGPHGRQWLNGLLARDVMVIDDGIGIGMYLHIALPSRL